MSKSKKQPKNIKKSPLVSHPLKEPSKPDEKEASKPQEPSQKEALKPQRQGTKAPPFINPPLDDINSLPSNSRVIYMYLKSLIATLRDINATKKEIKKIQKAQQKLAKQRLEEERLKEEKIKEQDRATKQPRPSGTTDASPSPSSSDDALPPLSLRKEMPANKEGKAARQEGSTRALDRLRGYEGRNSRILVVAALVGALFIYMLVQVYHKRDKEKLMPLKITAQEKQRAASYQEATLATKEARRYEKPPIKRGGEITEDMRIREIKDAASSGVIDASPQGTEQNALKENGQNGLNESALKENGLKENGANKSALKENALNESGLKADAFNSKNPPRYTTTTSQQAGVLDRDGNILQGRGGQGGLKENGQNGFNESGLKESQNGFNENALKEDLAKPKAERIGLDERAKALEALAREASKKQGVVDAPPVWTTIEPFMEGYDNLIVYRHEDFAPTILSKEALGRFALHMRHEAMQEFSLYHKLQEFMKKNALGSPTIGTLKAGLPTIASERIYQDRDTNIIIYQIYVKNYEQSLRQLAK